MEPSLPFQFKPKILPPLDPGFIPASLYNRSIQSAFKKEEECPLILGLERNDGEISRFNLKIFSKDSVYTQLNNFYVERIVKFLLWQRGGWKLFVGGSKSISEHLSREYSKNGKRSFDALFLGEQVFERKFELVSCDINQVPQCNETGKPLGRHLNGYRIGFDLGASDRKVSAVANGKVVYSEEVNWEPRKNANPEYHYDQIMAAIKTAASKLPRVDAIGGSSAGIFINNRPMVASIFRGIPPGRFGEITNLFLRIREELGVPLEVINDGDVTALAGSMSLEDSAILGIAMGSSLAAGYVNRNGHIVGWLNELAFAPIDYSAKAPVEEWSGDTGCGANYLSQQCVFRLADRVGINIPTDLMDAEKLAFVQKRLEAGDEPVVQIWQTMGVYLGYALAHYAQFYDIKHVLILGRCTSGNGGTILLEKANQVLDVEFPELKQTITVQLPDEHSRRIGQSIAAASLPYLDEEKVYGN
jgi:predicted NBD/HSP70 family sugar kinase